MTQAPNDRIDRIEATLERLAQLTFQNAARYDATLDRHDQALTRLEANANRNDQAIAQLLEVTSRNSQNINRMENAITNLTNRLDTFIERSDAERETFIEEIRQIWRYLRYEPGNGSSHSDNG